MSLKFVASCSLEDARSRIQTMEQQDIWHDYQLSIGLSRQSDDSWLFSVIQLPKSRTKPRAYDLRVEGLLQRRDAESTYVLGKAHGRLAFFDEITLNEVIVLVSTAVILFYIGENLLPQLGFGLLGLFLALAFVLYKWFDLRLRHYRLLGYIQSTLA